MDQVSRPFQIVLVLVLGFAGLWFVALRPKGETSVPPPTPALQAQPDTAAPAQAAPPKESPVPGGLGEAVDKATATKAAGDAAAAKAEKTDAAAPTPQNTTDTPVQTPPAQPAVKDAKPAPKVAAGPAGIVRSSTVAIGLVDTGIGKALGAKAGIAAPQRAAAKATPKGRPGFATPGKVRAALAKRHAVVLLFFSARSSDDRAVRRELAAVDRRGGRVHAWAVSVRGLPRFQNVLQDVQVLQNPTVVVLSRRAPYVFPGYTDHAQINQATAVALRGKRG